MLLSLGKNGLTSLFKEVRVFKVRAMPWAMQSSLQLRAKLGGRRHLKTRLTPTHAHTHTHLQSRSLISSPLGASRLTPGAHGERGFPFAILVSTPRATFKWLLRVALSYSGFGPCGTGPLAPHSSSFWELLFKMFWRLLPLASGWPSCKSGLPNLTYMNPEPQCA